MGSQLRNKKVVKDVGTWENLAYYLLHKRKMEMYQKVSKEISSDNSIGDSDKEEKKVESKNPFRDIRKKFEGLLDQNKNAKAGDDSVKAIIIEEISKYVYKMKFSQGLRSQILTEVIKK